MPHRHAIFGRVEEVVQQVLLPDAHVLGGELAQARGERVHVQVHDLRPHVEGHWQLEAAGGFRREPPALAEPDVFAFVVLGRGLRGLLVDGGDGVGACLGAGFEEVFGCAVGDVGFCGGFGDGVGAGAQGGDEGGLGGL